MDVSSNIDAYVHGKTANLKEELNVRHSKKDIDLFRLRKAIYLEEDIFKYFYPFCMINTTLAIMIILRKSSWFKIGFAGFAAI